MPQRVPAIDLLYHSSAHRGLAVTADAGCFSAPQQALAAMDQAGIAAAFVSQCKKWSCERQWMCVDTRLEDVLRFTEASPRFLGLAGYNPFDMAASVREIDFAAAHHGFRGVFLHAASFGLPLDDSRIYPLFARAAGLSLSVVVQLGTAERIADATLARIAGDVPELTLVLAPVRATAADLNGAAMTGENLAFALDPRALARLAEQPNAPEFFASAVFRDRCMWGSNGVSWPEALHAADSLPCPPETKARFLRHNAERIFRCPAPAHWPEIAEPAIAER